MSYQIIHADERGVRLRRRNSGSILSAAGVLFGLLFLSVGGGLVLFGQGDSARMGWAFLVGGLFFGVGPAWLISQRGSMDPRELVFDNEHGFLAVLQRRPTQTPRGFVAYQELAGFNLRTETRSAGVSQGGTTTSYPSYIVELKFKTGGTWDLLSYRSERAAAATFALLCGLVKLSKPCLRLPDSPLPPHMRSDDLGSVVVLSWRNPFPIGICVFLLSFFATFFTLLYTFGRIDHSGQQSSDWHLRIMWGVGLMVFAGSLYNLWASYGGSHRVTVSTTALLVERLGLHGTVVAKNSVPIADVVGIKFDFGETAGATPLTVWTDAAKSLESRRQESDLRLDFAMLAKEVEVALSRISIDVGMLSVAERLSVECFLNQALRSRLAGRGVHSVVAHAPLDPSFWWEHRAPLFVQDPGDSGGLLAVPLSNNALGILLMLSAPLPFGLLLFAMFTHGKSMLSPIALRAISPACVLTSLLAVWVALRLWRYRTGRLRAALLLVCALVSLVSSFRSGLTGLFLSAQLLQVILSIAAAIGILMLPDEDP